MSTNHWFVDAVLELAESAKAEGSKNTLCGLRTAFEVFLEEASITESDKATIQKLIAENTENPLELSCSN